MKALKKLAITMALTLSGTAFSQEITVFAAASMTNVLQDIQQDFEKPIHRIKSRSPSLHHRY